jgi:hypothetical protein
MHLSEGTRRMLQLEFGFQLVAALLSEREH